MWRAFFLAIGLSTFILGVECTILHSVKVGSRFAAAPAASTAAPDGTTPEVAAAPPREFVVAEWAPWSLMAAGSVVMLYSFTIPQRMHG